jgi:hypothetical protein
MSGFCILYSLCLSTTFWDDFAADSVFISKSGVAATCTAQMCSDKVLLAQAA